MLPSNQVELVWRKSQASSDQGACVEVALAAGRILVRDSKDPAGGALSFTQQEWTAFLTGVRSGEFDLPVT